MLDRALDLIARSLDVITLSCLILSCWFLLLYVARRFSLSRIFSAGFSGKVEEVMYSENLDFLFETIKGKDDPISELWREFFAWTDRPWEFISSAMKLKVQPMEEKIRSTCFWLELWALALVLFGFSLAMVEVGRVFELQELSLGELARLAVKRSASRLTAFFLLAGVFKVASASLEGRLELFKLKVQREMALAEALKFRSK